MGIMGIGGKNTAAGASPIIVTVSANASDHTFSVTATNAIGTSAPSASSGAVCVEGCYSAP